MPPGDRRPFVFADRAEATFGNSAAYGPPIHIDAQHARHIGIARGSSKFGGSWRAVFRRYTPL